MATPRVQSNPFRGVLFYHESGNRAVIQWYLIDECTKVLSHISVCYLVSEDFYIVRAQGFAERLETKGGDGTAALWFLRRVR